MKHLPSTRRCRDGIASMSNISKPGNFTSGNFTSGNFTSSIFTQRMVVLAALTGLTLGLSACGGGGGGTAGITTSGVGQLSGVSSRGADGARATKVKETAQTTPRKGSVLQTASQGVTVDQVKVTRSGNNLDVVAHYSESRPGKPAASFKIDTTQGGVQGRTSSGGFVSTHHAASYVEEGTTYGHLYTDLYSDILDNEDTDYMMGAIWTYVPVHRNNTDNDYSYGAFAYMNQPFSGSEIAALTGTAAYQGKATGVFIDQHNNPGGFNIGYFDADVALQADFGSGSEAGSIEGSLSGGKLYYKGNNEPALANDTLTALNSVQFGSTNLSSQAGGFFKGATTGTAGLSGQWGGQFGGTAGQHPTSVGGTFGAAKDDGSMSFLGVYGGKKESAN